MKNHNSFLRIESSIFVKPLVLFFQGRFVASFGEIGPVVVEEKILKFGQCIFTIPLEMGVVFHLNKLESSSPKNSLCLVWLNVT